MQLYCSTSVAMYICDVMPVQCNPPEQLSDMLVFRVVEVALHCEASHHMATEVLQYYSYACELTALMVSECCSDFEDISTCCCVFMIWDPPVRAGLVNSK